MRELFPEYEERTSKDFDYAWKQGLFVFDTNVLLNLYRYHTTTRDELIKVICQLSERIWVPHHVALEFQRNRLKVLAEQSRRFHEVRKTVEKTRSSLFSELDKLQLHKRHSLINPDSLTDGFSRLVDTFLEELDALRQNQQSITAPDPLKKKIEALFSGQVGTPPENQKVLDAIYKDAEKRFALKIPPGYEDSGKGTDKNSGPEEHWHGGLIYRRQFGDYLIWQQILDHAKAADSKCVIFVTDDNKEDWWHQIDAEGTKTIGPRPELVEEARIKGGIDSFLMYNPEGFLKYAKEFLKAQVSEETLSEVRDLSQIRRRGQVHLHEIKHFAERAENGIKNWLLSKFPAVTENRYGFPDFIASDEDRNVGFDVRVFSNPRMLLHKTRELLYRAYYETENKDLSEIYLVLIPFDPSDIDETLRIGKKMFRERMPNNVRILVGIFDDGSDIEEGEFIPYDDFSWDEANKSRKADA